MTVAVTDPEAGGGDVWRRRDPVDFRVEWYSGTGKGGQHRNKHQNSARITHLPTGLVRTAQTRSRESSQAAAMAALLQALDQLEADHAHGAVNGIRRDQIGGGAKADKRRTYRFQDEIVTDHVTGRRARTGKVMAGRFDLLWPGGGED